MQIAQVGRLRIGDYVSLNNKHVVHSFVNSSQVQLSESGAYKCQANNGHRTVEREARVDVRGPPMIARQLANLSALAGQSEPLKIQCPYSGYPISAVEWYYRPSDSLSNSMSSIEQQDQELDVYALTNLAGGSRQTREVRPPASALDNAGPQSEHQPEAPDPDQDEWLSQASAMTPVPGAEDYQEPQVPDYPGNLYTAYDGRMGLLDDYEDLEMDFQQRQPLVRARSRRDMDGRPGWIKYPQSRRHQTHSNGTLVIHELSRADQGFYRCRVLAPAQQRSLMQQRSSDSGELLEVNSNEFHLTVLVAPVISPFASSESLREGLRNFLTCSVIEGDSPIKLSWHKDGIPIEDYIARQQSVEPKRIRVETSNEYTSTLYFSHVDFKDNGNYTCIATNKAASVNYTARMLVNVPPKWIKAPKDLDCVAGQSIVIDCQAQAHPSARVWWEIGVYSPMTSADVHVHQPAVGKLAGEQQLLSALTAPPGALGAPQQQQQQQPADNLQSYAPNHYRTIISNSRVHILENASLVIRDVSKLDQGYYLCQAANNFGSLSALIKLTVNVGASFSAANKYLMKYVKLDEKVELDCDPIGQSPVEITWFMRPLAGRTGQSELPMQISANGSAASSKATENLGRRLFVGTINTSEIPASNSQQSSGHPFSRQFLASQSLDPNGGGEALTFELLQRSQTEPAGELVRLSIPRARQLHSADYICQAGNQFGTEHKLIKLLVQDVPEPVQEITVAQLESRSIGLVWKTPFNGHSPISSYTVEWAPNSSHHAGQPAINGSRWTQMSSQQPAITIGQLQPLTSYEIRIRAHNQLGVSADSPLGPLLVSTSEEAPNAPPSDIRSLALSSSSIQLTWSPPVSIASGHPQQVFSIKGYYLGYKVANTNESYIFKTVSLPTNEQQQVSQTDQSLQAQPEAVQVSPGQNKTGQRLRVLIGELKRSTKYSIIVQAFNSAGPGPQSDQLEAKTLASDPPPMPALRVGLATYSSIELHWTFQLDHQVHNLDPQHADSAPELAIDGYHVYYRSSEGQWQERRLSAETHSIVALGHQRQELSIVEVSIAANLNDSSMPPTRQANSWLTSSGIKPSSGINKSFRFVLDQLACGNSYQIYLVVYNAIGSGQPSQIVRAKTRGSTPIAPRRQDFITVNSSQVQLNLDAWMDAGCQISNFEIRYRQLHSSRSSPAAAQKQQAEQDQWLLLSNNLSPEQRSVELRDLQPETWYALLALAESAAGKTEVQYSFMTLDKQGRLPLEVLEALEANDRQQTTAGGLPALFKSGNNSLRSMLFNLSAGGSSATGGWSSLLLAGSLCLILFATCSLFLIRRYNNMMMSGNSSKDSRSLDSQTSRSLAGGGRHHLLTDGRSHVYSGETCARESQLLQSAGLQKGQEQYGHSSNYPQQMKASPCKTSTTTNGSSSSTASNAFLVANGTMCPGADAEQQCRHTGAPSDQFVPQCYGHQIHSNTLGHHQPTHDCSVSTCGQTVNQHEPAKSSPQPRELAAFDASGRFKTIGPHQTRPVSTFVTGQSQQLYGNSMSRPVYHCNNHGSIDPNAIDYSQQQQIYSKLSLAYNYNNSLYANQEEQKASEQIYNADAISLALLAQQNQKLASLKRQPAARQQVYTSEESQQQIDCANEALLMVECGQQQPIQIAVDSDGYGRYQPPGMQQANGSNALQQQQPIAGYNPYGAPSIVSGSTSLSSQPTTSSSKQSNSISSSQTGANQVAEQQQLISLQQACLQQSGGQVKTGPPMNNNVGCSNGQQQQQQPANQQQHSEQSDYALPFPPKWV